MFFLDFEELRRQCCCSCNMVTGNLSLNVSEGETLRLLPVPRPFRPPGDRPPSLPFLYRSSAPREMEEEKLSLRPLAFHPSTQGTSCSAKAPRSDLDGYISLLWSVRIIAPQRVRPKPTMPSSLRIKPRVHVPSSFYLPLCSHESHWSWRNGLDES